MTFAVDWALKNKYVSIFKTAHKIELVGRQQNVYFVLFKWGRGYYCQCTPADLIILVFIVIFLLFFVIVY